MAKEVIVSDDFRAKDIQIKNYDILTGSSALNFSDSLCEIIVNPNKQLLDVIR